MDTFLEVLKWIGIALGAGFVGYFGRYPAKLLFEWLTGRRKKTPIVTPPAVVADESLNESQARQKVEKKQAKEAVKIAKKTGKS